MRALLAITTREIQERRLVLVAALVLGIVAVLLPLLPHVTGADPAEIMVGGALGMAATLAFGTALFGGASMVGRDLVERRTSFYFARPVGALSIWGGKMLAAVFLAVAAFCVTIAPALTMEMRRIESAIDQWRFGDLAAPVLFLLAVIAAVIVGHYVHVALRSRSPWVALDLLAPVAIAGVLWLVVSWFAAAMAIRLLTFTGTAVLLVFLVALWVASGIGFVQGRGELREVHKRGSIALWSSMGVFALALLVYAGWLRTADADDLRVVGGADLADAGNAAVFAGHPVAGADYEAMFYFDPESGRSWRLGTGIDVALAADGKSVVWLESSALEPDRARAVRATLGGGRPEIVRTKLTFQNPRGLVASADGSRIALLQGDILGIWDVRTEEAVATAKVPTTPGADYTLVRDFLDPARVRIHLYTDDEARGNAIRVFEFDATAKQWTETGSMSVPSPNGFVRRSPDRTRILVRGRDGVTLRDASTGGLLATFDGADRGWAVFLPDGRILTFDRMEGRMVLHTSEGEPIRWFETTRSAGLPSYPRAGWISFLGSDTPEGPRRLYLLHLDSGAVRELRTTLEPVYWLDHAAHPPGSLVSKLYYADGALVLFDPFTGEARAIAGRYEESAR